MGTVINFERFLDKTKKSRGSVARKRGSNRLYVDFYYHGVRVVKSTGLDNTPENEQKVKEWLDRAIERIEKGIFVFAEAFPGASAKEKAFHAQVEGWDYKPDPQDVLFGDYTDEWVRRILEKDASKSKRDDQKKIIGYWLLPHFRNMTFHQINGVALKEFTSTLKFKTGKKAGNPLSASRIRNILIPLRSIWYDACEHHRWELSDPFSYLKQHGKIPKRKKRTSVKYEVFRFDEWMELMANFDPFYRPIAEVMIMTGMIGSEIAGLRKHEDILEHQIWVRNSIIRGYEKSELKNEYRERKLPITRPLRKLVDKTISRSEGNYVFTMKSGRNFDTDSFRKNPWTRAFKKARTPYKVPYTTRHTFAAWALTLGMDPNRLVSLMGHGSKEMVYEVYGKYVEGLETDAGMILDYFGKDFTALKQKATSPFANNLGESTSESGGVAKDN